MATPVAPGTDMPKRGAGEAKQVAEGLYIRIDMPGAPRKNLKMKIKKEKKAVVVSAVAPKEWDSDSGARVYKARVVLDGGAKLPEVAELENGCLRLLFKCATGSLFTFNTGINSTELDDETENMFKRKNPYMVKGVKGNQEMKFTSMGSFYIRLDLPGIRPGQEFVWPEENGTALLYGTDQADATEHDDMVTGFISRFDQRCGCCRIGFPQREMKNGVLRLLVPKIKVAPVCLCEMGKP